MTDHEKTIAYLEDMGYKLLTYLPSGEKAELRNYHVTKLYIRADQSSFTFDNDGELCGIGYDAPEDPYNDADCYSDGPNLYDEWPDDPFEEENRDPNEALDWDAPISEDDRRDMEPWENEWEDDE